jgi:hypothetical protein
MTSRKLSDEEAQLKQIRELDADTLAAKIGIRSFLSRYNRSRGAHPDAPDNRYYRNLEKAYYNFCLSLYVMFRTLGPYSEQKAGMRTNTHPPTLIRLVQIISVTNEAIIRSFARAGVLTLEDRLKKSQNLAAFEVAYNDITGLPFDDSLGSFWLTEECERYGALLVNGLEKLVQRRENPFVTKHRKPLESSFIRTI